MTKINCKLDCFNDSISVEHLDTPAVCGILVIGCVLLLSCSIGALMFDIKQLKMPNVSDVTMTEIALESESNATLKYILHQDLLYCPKNNLCSYSRPSNLVLLSCCEPCNCQPSCHYLDNCCPDIMKIMQEQHSNSSDNGFEKMRCIHPQLLDYLTSDVDFINQYFMISKCENKTDSDTTLKCERQDLNPNDLTMDILMPVTVGGNAYKNMFCAMCNMVNLTEAIYWRAEVRCPTAKSITGYSTTNLIQNLLIRRTCNLMFAPRTKTADCNIGLVRKCNVTGKWIQYDAFVEKACLSYTHVYRGVYRNVFCFMCNEEDDLYMQCERVDLRRKESMRLGSFNALIEFNSMTSPEQDDVIVDIRCPTGTIYYDIQQSCTKLNCNSPLAVSGMECTSVYEPKLFIFKLYFIIQSNTNSDSNLHSYMKNNPEVLFEVFNQIINNTEQSKLCEHELLMKEKEDFYKNTDFLIHLELRALYTHELIESLLSLDGKELPISNFSIIIYFEKNESKIALYEHKHYTKSDRKFCRFYQVIKFSRHLICPFVVVPRNETFISTDGSLCYIEHHLKCFSNLNFDCEENACKICADQISCTISSSTNRKIENNFETYLSFSCSLVSMTSLLATIATFSCFSSLRSLPGLNTMGLSISLLMSHGLYSFGMYQIQIKDLCIGLGILTHFSWLNSFTWMNVCSLHMYRVFRLIKLDTLCKYRTFFKYMLYSILLPTTIVALHISISFYTSNTVGYGGHMCYISEFRMVLYFFALPLAVGLIINIVLFLSVVIKTSRLPDVSKDMTIQRNTLIIYIKLASLTGITWLFGFLYQYTNVKELSYIHTVLNGIQGLYILMSFSFNARVRRLYKMSFTSKSSTSKSRLKAEES